MLSVQGTIALGRSAVTLLDNRGNALLWRFFVLTEAQFNEWVARHGLNAICGKPVTQDAKGLCLYFQTWMKEMDWKSQAKISHLVNVIHNAQYKKPQEAAAYTAYKMSAKRKLFLRYGKAVLWPGDPEPEDPIDMEWGDVFFNWVTDMYALASWIHGKLEKGKIMVEAGIQFDTRAAECDGKDTDAMLEVISWEDAIRSCQIAAEQSRK